MHSVAFAKSASKNVFMPADSHFQPQVGLSGTTHIVWNCNTTSFEVLNLVNCLLEATLLYGVR